MTTAIDAPEPRSDCCNARVRVREEGTTRDSTTHWFECVKCGEPCDLRDPDDENA